METKDNNTTCRIHRVGSVTTGLCLISFGVMLFLHTVFGLITYQLIFSFWPLILIGLGIELLLSNFLLRKIVYDKAAMFLMIIMAFFSIGMAVADVCIRASEVYISNL